MIAGGDSLLNYNKLYYFYHVAKKANLTRAASFLHVSQPSLSKAIKDLEDQLGAHLFYRTNRSMLLTPAGETLFLECAPFFNRESEIIQKVLDKAAAEVEPLRFGYMVYKAIYQIPRFLASYQRLHPEIQLISQPFNERLDINEALLNGSLDIGLKLFTIDELIPSLAFQILEEHPLSIVVPVDHHLAARSSVALQELASEDFVFLGTGDHSSEFRFAMNWCNRCGFLPRITVAYDRVESVLTMVQSGAGISLLSEFAPINHMTGLKSIPLKNAPMIYSALFWNKERSSPSVQSFVKAFFEAASLLPSTHPQA